jgi:putative transcriptional regulator
LAVCTGEAENLVPQFFIADPLKGIFLHFVRNMLIKKRGDGMRCYNCGKDMSVKRGKHHYIESGLDNVYLLNIDFLECDCGEKMVCIPFVPELNKLIGKNIIKKQSPLNGKEIRFLRKNMGLKAQVLKEMLGVDNATISRWEKGTQKMSPSNDRLLRIIYANMMNVPKENIAQLITDGFRGIGSSNTVPPPYQIDTKNILKVLPA